MQQNLVKISKYLSYLLRHKPEAIALELDSEGWAAISELITKTKQFKLTREIIELVVETDDKQRFRISDDGKKIRANQGHSIEVDLGLSPISPPDFLWHGTAQRFLESIMEIGLVKKNRHHVHLTESVAVAKAVGSRYGKPVILKIAAQEMHQNGYEFFKTVNNVWLVDKALPEFIEVEL